MKLPKKSDRLDRSFYDRPTATVAREMLGKALLRRIGNLWVGGMIVETEAYLAEGDSASHSARGRTPGNASMFERPGTLYVYPIHAKHCLNLTTEATGRGCAVLVRAIEPVWGIAAMQANRGQTLPRRLTGGPAMTCQALQIDRGLDGTDSTTHPSLYVAKMKADSGLQIGTSSRIGISKSQSLNLRFFVIGNPCVSGRRSAQALDS